MATPAAVRLAVKCVFRVSLNRHVTGLCKSDISVVITWKNHWSVTHTSHTACYICMTYALLSHALSVMQRHKACRTAFVRQSLSHRVCHTESVKQSLSHRVCHTESVTQSLSHRVCHTESVTQSLSHRSHTVCSVKVPHVPKVARVEENSLELIVHSNLSDCHQHCPHTG